jgi:DNA adenine methylase
MDMLEMFDDLTRGEETFSRKDCLKAPFAWQGGKSKTVHKILPHLPYYRAYVEVFGGSGAVLLARSPSKLEVYNDRFGGVCDFYRCLHDKELSEKLRARLEFIVHSRELFYFCRDTWENTQDIVERAARWYYSSIYSFASKGTTFGRSFDAGMGNKHFSHWKDFPAIHRRLANVLIENLDFRQIFKDCDSPDTVFYCDPPYINTSNSSYKHELGIGDHRDLMSCIFNCKGFVALSGYPNALYDDQPWDNKFVWEVFVSTSLGAREGNNLQHPTERGNTKECLWIKEAAHG